MICFELKGFPDILLLGRRICNSDWGYSHYRIQSHELIFVYQGRLDLTVNGRTFVAAEGDCVLLKPGEIFSLRTDPDIPAKYYIVHFRLDGPVENVTPEEVKAQVGRSISTFSYMEWKDVFEMPQTGFRHIYLLEHCAIEEHQERIFHLLETSIAEANRLKLSNEMMLSLNLGEILILLSRIAFKQLGINIYLNEGYEIPRPVQEAIFYIHGNYMKKIGTEDISELLNISPQYLIRIFKKHLRITPVQYINHFRIARAKELLRYTSLYIKEVSYEVGIQNPYYFCRLFKELEGITPTEYRNRE